MLKHSKLLALFCTCCVIVLLAAGDVAARSRLAAPHRFQPASEDTGLVQVQNPVDGRTWAAWAFRSGAEYDIAVALLGDDGRWGEPTFLGRYDGRDQIEPTFVVHESGGVALAFAEPTTDRILVSTLAAGARSWSRPLPVVAAEDIGSPSLMLFGDRLVLGFRSGDRVELRAMSLAVSSAGVFSIADGPDPVGMDDGLDSDKGDNQDDEEETNDNSDNRTGMVPFIDNDRD
jgi:hypothetical protein